MSARTSELEALREKLTEVFGPEPAETLMSYLGDEPPSQDDQQRVDDQLQSGMRQLSAMELRIAEQDRRFDRELKDQSRRLTDKLAEQNRRFARELDDQSRRLTDELAEQDRCFTTKLADQKHQIKMEALSAKQARLDAKFKKQIKQANEIFWFGVGLYTMFWLVILIIVIANYS